MENVGVNDSARAVSRSRFSRRGASPPAAGSPADALAPAPVPGAHAPSQLPEAVLVIDALGRKCPIPIIMLAEQIRDVPIGSVVAVLADDPAAYSDIPAWCQMKSHGLAFREAHQSGWAFGITRNY
jgi:tRNA 2-thiouridine synthesizing protein A